MKKCNRCLVTKPVHEFSTADTCTDGHRNYCKTCQKKKKDEWRSNNKERHNAKSREWARANPDKRKEICAKWYYSKPREYFQSVRKSYSQKNPDKVRASVSARRNRVRSQMPSWANTFFIKEAYELASLRSRLTGINWHVDHIVPLKGEFVCGLHVENNLQVIPAVLNMQKGNKFNSGENPRNEYSTKSY